MQRQKSFAAHFFGIWGWLTLGALGLVAIFAIIGWIGARNAERFANQGADTTATITDKRRSTDGDGGTDYRLRYRFTVDNETVEDRQDVSFLFYQTVSEGDEVPVRYWTGDPTLSEIESGDTTAMRWIGMIGAVVTGFLALVFARKAWARAAHATWMARHGVRRQVTITGLRETNVTINDTRQWQATWREADGREGATRMAPLAKLPAEGSTITILVDPDHRQDSVWEGDLLA